MEDRRENDVLKMTNEEYRVSSPDYEALIIEMISKINDKWILEQIYRCIKNITKEG